MIKATEIISVAYCQTLRVFMISALDVIFILLPRMQRFQAWYTRPGLMTVLGLDLTFCISTLIGAFLAHLGCRIMKPNLLLPLLVTNALHSPITMTRCFILIARDRFDKTHSFVRFFTILFQFSTSAIFLYFTSVIYSAYKDIRHVRERTENPTQNLLYNDVMFELKLLDD